MKKLLALILATLPLAAMDHNPSRMAFSFILNPDGMHESAPTATPTVDEAALVDPNRSRMALETCVRAMLAKHRHTPQKSHPCPEPGCTYVATTTTKLTLHMRTHTGERPYKCPYLVCLYAAKKRGTLNDHILTHAGDKRFKCPEPGCTYTTLNSGDLKKHRCIHNGEMSHKCPEPGCIYATAQLSNLKRHILCIHKKELLSKKAATA